MLDEMRILYREDGFTLLELTVSSVVMGIIAVIAFSIIYNQTTTFNTVFNHTVAIGDARKAVKVMRVEFRNLAHGSIQNMTRSQFSFLNDKNENISYSFLNNEVKRNGEVLISGLKMAPFGYLNIDLKNTANKDSVKFVKIILNVAAEKQSHILEENIYVRN